MDYRKLPVAKRTRLSNDKCLMEQYYAKRAKPESDHAVLSSVACVDLDSDEESRSPSDSRSLEKKKGESSSLRRSEKRSNVDDHVVWGKLKKDCHASNDHVEVVDLDVDDDEESIGIKKGESSDSRGCVQRSNVNGSVVGKKCLASNDGNYDGDEYLRNKYAGLGVIEITDGEEEEEGDGPLVTDGENVKVDDVVDEELSDFSSEDDTEESDDETYGEECTDHVESLDESNSYDNLVDEGTHDLDDYDVIECSFGETNDLIWKGKGKLVEDGQNANKSVNRRKETVDDRLRGKFGPSETEEPNSCTDKSNDDNEDETDEEDRTVKSGFKKRLKSQNVENRLRSSSKKIYKGEDVNLRKYGQSSLEAEVENSDEYVKKVDEGDEGRRKNMRMTTERKTYKNLNYFKILADSLHGEGEVLEKFLASDGSAHSEKKPEYKFWYPEKKPEEKSEFDEELNKLFAFCEMSIAAEDIGSASPKKPSSQRRRNGYFVQSESSSLSDHFQDTGAEKYGFEDCNTTGTVWDLVPGTRRSMYEHQREGFEFIWKNLAGGTIIQELEKSLSSSGSGCIISHAPGSGKTRLTIVFLQSFMKLYPDSRPVIIAPKSMLLTWEEEFRKWNINIPFHNMNSQEFSGHENPAAVYSSKKIRGSRNNESVTRVVKLLSWKMGKSILGITYSLFDKLVRGETRNADCTPMTDQMGKALLKFPTVLILDEGHTPRNDQSFIYNSLRYVETKRRIILSGTPFQNNFTELYNTLRLVNPKFNAPMKKNLRKISKELKSRWSIQKLRELKAMISPFVHVHKGKILQKSCPGLKDALIHLQLTDLQQELITVLSTNDLTSGYLELSHSVSLVSVHPSLLPERCFDEHQILTYRDRLERPKSDPYSGAKTKFVLEFCRLSEALNEKVLVYSQYIDPLMFLKEQLWAHFRWTEGREVLYMDGSLEAKQWQSSISALNDPKSKVRVLLASIKACSEGIHLVGASRVVLLDVVWNPSVERQAISRAYRIGQKNVVYTYHLIAEDMEFQKYKVHTAKDQLSEMVFFF